MERIVLVVDDNPELVDGVKLTLEMEGYQVLAAIAGQEALDILERITPDLILADIMMPGMDGYELYERVHQDERWVQVPFIFLTAKTAKADIRRGKEMGADDYITKPFDLEELKLRVKNAMVRSQYESLTNATTGLPSGRLIEDQLRRLIRRDNWGIIYVGIKGFAKFKDEYGFVAGEEVLRFAAMIMGRSVDNLGTSNDFIGHIGGDDFWIVAEKDSVERLTEDLRQRFDAEIGTHYDWKARQEGNLMTLSIGVVTVDDGPFYDIREITEAASSARREAS